MIQIAAVLMLIFVLCRRRKKEKYIYDPYENWGDFLDEK
jgi:hypothetical protein